MGQVPSELLYTQEHQWVRRLDDRKVQVGMTAFAQQALGDIVFVELPKPGMKVTAEQSMGSVESVKSVSDVYAPVDGEVLRVNDQLEESPRGLNEDPYGEGWMVELAVEGEAALEGLLTAQQYEEYTTSEEG